MRKILTLAIAGFIAFSHAETFTYTTIGQKLGFKERWQLSDKELARYEKVMVEEGHFRYPKLSPLEVLAITAPDEETMRYYAKKAAADEMKAVEAQIRFAVMVTEEKTILYERLKAEMEKRKLAEQNARAEQVLLEEKIKAIIAESEKLNAKEEASQE